MKDKVVLVTGGNGGLGTYVTQAFLDVGATVVGTSRKILQCDFDNPDFTALARTRWERLAKCCTDTFDFSLSHPAPSTA
jgi:NAD(P)-dependent dehydrogenase (short-subunit alcohol dehydrogenase family)